MKVTGGSVGITLNPRAGAKFFLLFQKWHVYHSRFKDSPIILQLLWHPEMRRVLRSYHGQTHLEPSAIR